MSEETNQLSQTRTSMETAEFEEKLTAIFSKHKQSKLRLVSRIAFEFKGQEEIVLEHLHNKYVLGIVSEKPTAKINHNAEEHTDTPKNSEAPAKEKSKKKNVAKAEEPEHAEKPQLAEKPKSKKKLIILIIIGVVVVALGGTGFMMKDKIMGIFGKGAKTETEAPKEKATTESKTPKAKKDMTPQQVEAILDSLDNSKKTPKDSTKKP